MSEKESFQNKNKERLVLDRLWILLNKNLEKAVKKIANEQQLNKINELKTKLGWEGLPYNNLDEFIQELSYPRNTEEEAINLLRIIGEIIYPILQKIKARIDSKFTTSIDDYLRIIIAFSNKYQWIPEEKNTSETQ